MEVLTLDVALKGCQEGAQGSGQRERREQVVGIGKCSLAVMPSSVH